MKKVLILLFISFSCLAQTKLDTLVFNKINEYRVSKGLNKLLWDTIAFKASKCHSDYLEGLAAKTNYKTITTGHSESTKGLEHSWNRYAYFGGVFKSVGEIVLTNSLNFKDNDASKLTKLVDILVKQWKDSPEHNKIMITSNYNFGGVSCKVVTKSVGLKGFTNYQIWSTFVFVDTKIPD